MKRASTLTWLSRFVDVELLFFHVLPRVLVFQVVEVCAAFFGRQRSYHTELRLAEPARRARRKMEYSCPKRHAMLVKFSLAARLVRQQSPWNPDLRT